MSSVMHILVFLKILISCRDILKNLKKKNVPDLASKKDEYTSFQVLDLKKKIDKYPVFSTKNVATRLVNS